MTKIIDLYQSAHPDTEVAISFGASSLLARQIRAGAPIDVFVSADARLPGALARDGLVLAEHSIAIASNRLVVIAADPLAISLDQPRDLLDSRLRRIAIPEFAVPVGRYAREWLQANGLLESMSARTLRTEHALATLRAVDSGYADVAIVYATDARLARSARIAFEIPDEEQPEILYVATPVARSRSPEQAADFVEFLADPPAASILVRAGFGRPPSLRGSSVSE